MLTSRRRYLRIVNLFIALTIVALLATVYLTFARATVFVPGDREQFTATTSAEVDLGNAGSSMTTTVFSQEFEVSDSFPVRAKESASKKAGGMVTLVNKYSRTQPLVRFTRLVTPDGKLFRIAESVNIPAGGTVEVFAEADEEGDAYLVNATTFTIPGLWEGLRELIYAESAEPMTYERVVASVITAEDITTARNALQGKITQMALAEFKAQLPGAPLTEKMLLAGNAEFSTTPAEGAESTSLTAHLKQEFTAVNIDREHLGKFTQENLISKLPDPNQFMELIPESVTYSLTSLNADRSKAQIEAEASAWIHSQSSLPSLDMKQLTGKALPAAQAYLNAAGVPQASIQLSIPWLPLLPFLENHILLKIQ